MKTSIFRIFWLRTSPAVGVFILAVVFWLCLTSAQGKTIHFLNTGSLPCVVDVNDTVSTANVGTAALPPFDKAFVVVPDAVDFEFVANIYLGAGATNGATSIVNQGDAGDTWLIIIGDTDWFTNELECVQISSVVLGGYDAPSFAALVEWFMYGFVTWGLLELGGLGIRFLRLVRSANTGSADV